MSLTGLRIEHLPAGGAEWSQKISASKVAAILGLSPWESRFSLWHRMHGDVPAPEMTAAMSRGHYLEPAIVAWFADQFPEWLVEYDQQNPMTFQHPEHPELTASPDGLIHADGETYLLEIKTDGDGSGWGAPGSSDIPPYYFAQVQHQMEVTGARRTYVAVLSPFLRLDWYVVDYEPDAAKQIRAECLKFLDTLRTGERPDIDGHTATYQTAQQLHPDIDPDQDVELDSDLAARFCRSRDALKAAETEHQRAKTEVVLKLRNGKAAVYGDKTIATRRPSRNGGAPYLQAAAKLPTFEEAA